MTFTRIFWAFFAAACVLALVHNVAVQLFLYWTYLWFDIPMHFLGGVVVALGYQAFFSAVVKREHSFYAKLIPTVVVLLAVGLLWEVYEVVIDIPIDETYVADTLLDLVMDVAGGVSGYILARHLRQREYHG